MGFAREGDGHGRGGRVGGVVEVEGAVPRGGDEELVRGAVDDAPDGLVVLGHDGLGAGFEVESVVFWGCQRRPSQSFVRLLLLLLIPLDFGGRGACSLACAALTLVLGGPCPP